MEITSRKAVSSPLDKFDSFCEEDSFIEVTEWSNGEGWDIVIDNGAKQLFSLSIGEKEALIYLINTLENGVTKQSWNKD